MKSSTEKKEYKPYPQWCWTPDYETGGYEVREHNFDKDGWCIFCGYNKNLKR